MCLPLAVSSRIPQIWLTHSNGSVGDGLSLLTFGLTVLGALARVFTTFIELGDNVELTGYLLSVLFNGIICLQIVWYRYLAKKKKN